VSNCKLETEVNNFANGGLLFLSAPKPYRTPR